MHFLALFHSLTSLGRSDISLFKKTSNRKLNQTGEKEMHWVMQIGKEGMVSSLGRTKTQVTEEGLVTLSSSMYPQIVFPRGEDGSQHPQLYLP